MTIDEAIQDFRQLEYDFEHYMCDTEDKQENLVKYQQEYEYYKQLADWLEELKDYQDKNKMVVRINVENMDESKDKINELSKYAENQYRKCIDNYKNSIKEELERFEVKNLDTCILYDLMDRKAERLKAGNSNGS